MNFKNKSKLKDNNKSAAIYSAALQDHFLKKFNSSIDIDFTKKNR